MEFRLLGPVEAIANGKPVPLGGRHRRTVLAILLVNARVPVTTGRLIDELWGDSPPETARKTVQAHIAHLRKSLNVDGEVLSPTVDGYVLLADEESIDVGRFERLVAEARPLLASQPRRSADKLRKALDLFRGAPLSGTADDAFSLRVEASRLEQLRLTAVEDHLDARLAAGDDEHVITETSRLVEEHPLRERIWALLMLGLYRAGRQSEALRAYSRVRQTLAEELGVEPSPELQGLEQRILDHDPSLTEPAPVEVVSKPVAVPALRNPYKGLRAFDEDDAADFFGREDLVRRLRERLEARGASPLVMLAGPSGAGKSSAVRAGLIPELRQQERDVVVMFPGDDPFGSLTKATAEVTGESSHEVRQRLDTGGPPAGASAILVVDQFEELFTMAGRDEANRFLGLLTEARDAVPWVVTVRADFLDRMLSHPLLGALLEDALVLVPPLQDHEVAAAVTGPAQRVGVAVEPELVNEIIRDVRTQAAALPLFQYALTDTFERRRGESLTLADYRSAGGISGALSRRAEEVYESMDKEQREATRQLLLTLVTVTEESEEVRRRVDRETMMSLSPGEERLQAVMERLGAQRLLTFDQAPETGKATVEVAHEALISEWPRLARWVEESRDDIRLRERLSAAAKEWVESDRDAGFLLTGSRLEQFSGWASVTDLELTDLERNYLNSSLEARQVQQRRASRTRRLVIGGVAAAIVVATGLGVFALSQQQATEEQARIVRAADLAAAANDSLAIDPERSILLAIEAVETTRMVDGTVLNVAEEALHRAVLGSRLLGRVTHTGAGIAHFSPDGRSFVTSAEDSTSAQIWSVDPFELVLTLTGHTDDVVDAVFDPAGDRVATASLDGTVRVWDSATGELQMTFGVDGARLLVPVFSNDGSRLGATSVSGVTRVWDIDTGQVMELASPEGTLNTLNLEFSPDDSLLAVTRGTDGTTPPFGPLLFDVATGELVRTLEGHPFATDIGFTPDGSRVVTSGGADPTVKVLEVESGDNIATYFGHQGPVQDLQISADGSTVASSGLVDVRVWDLATFQTKAVIVGHSGLVDGIDLSLSGDLLLTASDTDGTTRLWDMTPYWSHELIGLPGPTGQIGGIAYTPDGELLAAGRGSGLVTLWDPLTGGELESFEGPGQVQEMEFSPDGTRLVIAGSAGVELHGLGRGEDIASLVEARTNGVAFSSQGMLATSSSDGVRLWESPFIGEGELISNLEGIGVAFDPEGEILAVSLSESLTEEFRDFVEIRDVDSGELVATLSEHTKAIPGLAFDRDGELLATASDDTRAIIWDTTTFEPVHRLKGHTAGLLSVEFDPLRPEVATAGGDAIRIWNLETGLLRVTLSAPEAVLDLAYSPDGRYLAAVSPEGFVTVYMLDVDELVGEAKSRLTRWWTEAECLQYLQAQECPPAPEAATG